MADNSDKYLEKRGKRWYLKGADDLPIGGVQRIVPSKAGRKVFEKGYYYFEADGRLCTKKDCHAVAQTVGKRNFRGVYYFGGKNGKLYAKKGWITVRGKRYYLTDAGKRVTNKWKSGYYLQANGAAASIGDGGRNMTSAKDCGVLLERIYKGRCVSKKYSGKMLAFLKQQQRKWKIPAGLPSGVASANKTGKARRSQE